MHEQDRTGQLQSTLLEAVDKGTALRIVGGGSKDFYGRNPIGEPYRLSEHRGIIDYQPTELVVTVRAGTPVAVLQAVLAERGQTLLFEPPQFSGKGTIGGTIACNFSGPGRPFSGAARDYVLGIRMLTGQGRVLTFGGQVMKNVAGYDLSRLTCGALGTLGVILEVSLKVLPVAEAETTVRLEMKAGEAIRFMNRCAGEPHPVTGMCFDGERVHIRLSGASAAVSAARKTLGGEEPTDGAAWWCSLREYELAFFDQPGTLWRLSVRSGYPPLDASDGSWLLDWGGALRWLRTSAPAESVQALAVQAGGHATAFRGGDRQGEVFRTLDPVLMRLHRNIKNAMDPLGLLNPGRLYGEL